ncbi:hypothetical protein Z043_117078 [Scleropages formosus]|uniref:Uncharacterized protein n=1 Tax=Scleropages formosus TaxID=113540 RepID=A0A0P7WRM5_SCLFO|nr:hypothetical protein Z043_117078 [Scleropages formosus]
MIYLVLILGTLHCAAQADEPEGEAVAMTGDFAPNQRARAEPSRAPPPVCCGVDELKEGLSQLVQEQREVASGQAEVIRILRVMKDQGAQQLLNLQNLARHQSLLLENHQALLLQVSRIGTQLQELTKKAPSEKQGRHAA